MPDPNEHKQTVDETMDKFFDDLDGGKSTEGEQPQESSPETEQVETQTEDGSDPAKTPSTDETTGFEGVDKGFANHPKWMERENQLKEARAKLKERETQDSLYAKLLDDPQVYAKFLKAQGFSDDHIRQALADKGFSPQEKPQSPDSQTKGAQAQQIAEKACQKLGWDIKRLNQEQIAYLKDHVSLTMAVLEDTVGSMLDQRLRPLEEDSRRNLQERQLTKDEQEVRRLAKEEFPTLDYEKDIEPAMHRYLDELDKRDPQKKVQIGYEDLYQRATRNLLKELRDSKGRQEVRDINKGNARPLTPGASTPQSKDKPLKGKTVSETADKVLDAMGVR